MAYPSGTAVRVEHQWSHREFVEAVEPETVVIDLVGARQLVKRGLTADEFFGEEPAVVVTSTVSDSKLDLITWERERDVVEQFSPDYHVPTDYSIYGGHDKRERVENIEQMVEGSVWMKGELADADVTLIPQVKGFTVEERRICYQALSTHFDDYALFYAAQYFGGSSGNRINDLVDDLQTINEESGTELFVLGLLAPQYVARLPENVRAVAGQHRWRQRVTPRESSPVEMLHSYALLERDVERALGTD